MKFKSILKSALILSTIMLIVSCKKEYTCVCSTLYVEPAYTDSNGNYHQQYMSQSSVSNTIKARKKNSDSACRESPPSKQVVTYTSAPNQGPIIYSTTCEIP